MIIVFASATAVFALSTFFLWQTTGDMTAVLSASVIVMIVFLFLDRSLRSVAAWQNKLLQMRREDVTRLPKVTRLMASRRKVVSAEPRRGNRD